MDAALPRVLVAGLSPLMRDMCAALGSGLIVIPAQSLEEAERRLQDDAPRAVLVAYHFDELRPFRLIRHVRRLRGNDLPILLVRVLGVDMGASEAEIRQGYQSLGANDFFDFHALAQRDGEQAALDQLCERMRALVRRPMLWVR